MSAAVSESASGLASPRDLQSPFSPAPMADDQLDGYGDPAADPRKMRRIIAEDPTWNMPGVPSLVQLCCNVLVGSYHEQHAEGGQYHGSSVLDTVGEAFREKLVSKLSTTIPLEIVANLDHDGYWQRRSKERTEWAPHVVKEHGGSWRRFYFEHHVRDLLENVAPEDEDDAMSGTQGILARAEMASPFVHRLDLRQLLPPQNVEPEEPLLIPARDEDDGGDGAEEDDGDDDDDTDAKDHVDIVPVLRQLKNLKDLKLCYVVRNCGMDFKWSMFGMTTGDCGTLFRGIRDYTSLSSLAITRSLLGDHKTRMLCKYLLGNKTIVKLDLSHNSIGCSGARAIAKLMNNSVLEELDVRDNKIGEVGAKALGRAIRTCTHIRSVNVRLNQFGDGGGHSFFKGAAGSASLLELNVSTNNIGPRVMESLCLFVDHNATLTHLDLTCNALGEQTGRRLLEALDGNEALRSLDMRLTKFDKDTEYQINTILKRNMKAHAKSK